MTTLVRLRWAIPLVYLAAAGFSKIYLRIEPAWPVIGLVIAATALTNTLALAWGRRREGALAPLLSALLLLDTIALTLVLLVSGGPANPFSALYVVQVVIALIGARRGNAWPQVAAAIACYGVLFIPQAAIGLGGVGLSHMDEVAMRSHYLGMWLALSSALLLAGYFGQRIIASLARQSEQLEESREASARNARFAALTTLAAGAAHELGNPLGTIAIAAGELSRRLGDAPPPVARDVQLIRDEVGRCRRILDRMHSAVTEEFQMTSRSIRRDEFQANLGRLLRPEELGRVRLEWDDAIDGVSLQWGTLITALISVVRNALDAAPAGSEIRIVVSRSADTAHIEVVDRGPGIPAAVLERIGEPFVSTKAPGDGMGLGLFLVRITVERLGGQLQVESTQRAGTAVRLSIPLRLAQASA
jgi:two-component system sensor histidine kinase RegB